MVDNNERVLEAFSRYRESLSAFDSEAMAVCCELPFILFGASGFVLVPSAKDAVRVFGQIAERLRILGYSYSGGQIEARLSNDGMALINGTEIRYSRQGQELHRFELNYVLRRNGDAWRIVAGTVHEGDLN
ncbi:hypothetical protein [Noviherbaspirillum sp. ST9]|uniref:DUF6841 family protein n=1 Tax=Noviherbaspirillum sp. ST9 TaxID=3401606 RepID=UPI003B58ADE2